MDNNKNYYLILELNNQCEQKEIKKSYYRLSFLHHPDKSGSSDWDKFNDITEAYKVLSNAKLKEEYDSKSKWGKNYDEYFELFDINIDFDYETSKQKLADFKKNQINNIQIEIDENFNGSVEYERWVVCNACEGSGKDLKSKIVIRDKSGKITKIFDPDDGCDFCDGKGMDSNGNKCAFCHGMGKIGINLCTKCNGEGRILGKQKLSNIKIDGDMTRIDSMGHYGKDGKTGYLLLKKI
jgi:molecular chaperone DnaJ